MSQETNELEEALLSYRNDFISRQNKAVGQAIEQFGKRNVKARKLDIPETNQPEGKHTVRKASVTDKYKTGYLVRLGVRKKRIAYDEMFEYQSDKLSQLEARLEAEKAARKAGYPIIGYVYSIDKL